jgi:predicted nucleic acid-binding protein
VTLYLDTSSLVKLYVEEVGSDDVRNLVAHATIVATSIGSRHH